MKQIPGQLYKLKGCIRGAWSVPYNYSGGVIPAPKPIGTIVLLVNSVGDKRLCLVGENLFWFDHKALGELES